MIYKMLYLIFFILSFYHSWLIDNRKVCARYYHYHLIVQWLLKSFSFCLYLSFFVLFFTNIYLSFFTFFTLVVCPVILLPFF